jgi:Spy/CpxP family protein refolding chaperone
VISRSLLTVVLVVGAWGAPALAQEEAPDAPGRPARDEAFKMVDAYVVSNLQESLGLTDEQFAKAIPLVKKLQGDRREALQERARTVREMRRLLRQGGATETQVLDLLGQLKKLDAESPAQNRKNLDALDAVLTPIQQAKFRVLELEVEQRIREIMGRARPRQGQGARPPRE